MAHDGWTILQRILCTEERGISTALLSNAILKWQASDHVEREGDVDARSFMWRAGYYDIILTVVQLCHGAEVAKESAHMVMRMYGEKLEDYLEEFS
jgi:hypothetical protein